jgi:hypothetical protein
VVHAARWAAPWSPHTIASYRETFRLLFGLTAQRTVKQPSELDIIDLDAPLVAAFLDYLQVNRRSPQGKQNSPRGLPPSWPTTSISTKPGVFSR